VPAMQLRVERVGAFSLAAQIAEQYRERRGFLIGDAAYRMTPMTWRGSWGGTCGAGRNPACWTPTRPSAGRSA
jgi:hypothetical protein